MKEVLQNMALLDTNRYCHENNIDMSSTHIYKYPKHFTYALLKSETGRALVTITYYKNRTPSYFKH